MFTRDDPDAMTLVDVEANGARYGAVVAEGAARLIVIHGCVGVEDVPVLVRMGRL